ncbi:MAG: 30S ribosome-binding factor RbfA [Elusimicrobia bacterium]|nr:30S ribosome-binding factor RbfA [Elusimicrobiota bacterium]
MQSYKRSVRVAELIQQELANIVRDIKNREIGFTTITTVTLTDDLQTARAFYSVIGTEEETQKTAVVLKAAVKEIRHELAVRLNLRRTPTLEFVFDETPVKADRIFELLEKIKSEEPIHEKEPEDENPEN